MIQVGSVALDVRDLDGVARFYRDVVGLEELGRDGDSVQLGAGGVAFLELRHRAGLLPRDPAAAGLYHTAFLLPSRKDLGRWLVHAGQIGQRLDGAADHLVSEAVYLHDPEGNGIEIYADRDKATWTWEATPDGPRVKMANDRLDIIGLHSLGLAEGWTGAPPGTRIGHVHLQVGDTAQAAKFFTGPIGMDVTRQWPQAVFLSSGGYHHHIAANTWHSAGAGPRDPARAGLAAVTLVEDGRRESLRDPWGTEVRFVPA